MPQYHINPESGSPKVCMARSGNCPYGSDAPHYTSMSEARFAAEILLASECDTFAVLSKDSPFEPKSLSERQVAEKFANEVTLYSDNIRFYDRGTSAQELIPLSMTNEGVVAMNNCQQASRAIEKHLANSSLSAEVMGVEFSDGTSHIAVRSISAEGEPIIVDYTARQFGLDLPHPLVLEESKWQALIKDRVMKLHNLSIKDE